jgi:pyrroline-5-carboxylate reductase
MKIGFIGAGNMGTALIKGYLVPTGTRTGTSASSIKT